MPGKTCWSNLRYWTVSVLYVEAKFASLSADLFFDWDNPNSFAVNTRQIKVVKMNPENLCQLNPSAEVKIGIPLR